MSASRLERRKLFDRIAARTLAMVFEEFPIARDFDALAILQPKTSILPKRIANLAGSTLDWLHGEGFIRHNGGPSRHYDPGAKISFSRISKLSFDNTWFCCSRARL